MNHLLHALRAERLKLRNTLALWLCLLAPMLAVLFGALVAWGGPLQRSAASPGAHWNLLADSIFSLWASFMLPFFVTLESALLAGLEHGNAQWKHLMALPLPRCTHYVAKLATLLLMALSATVLVTLATPLAGWLLAHAAGQSGLAGLPPLVHLARLVALVALGMLCMVSLQCYVALRWPNFTVATAFGIVATMAALFLPDKHGLVARLFPWSMPAAAFLSGHDQWILVLAASAAGFVAVVLWGCVELGRREWT